MFVCGVYHDRLVWWNRKGRISLFHDRDPVFSMRGGMVPWRDVKTLRVPLTFLHAGGNDLNRGQHCWAGSKTFSLAFGTCPCRVHSEGQCQMRVSPGLPASSWMALKAWPEPWALARQSFPSTQWCNEQKCAPFAHSIMGTHGRVSLEWEDVRVRESAHQAILDSEAKEKKNQLYWSWLIKNVISCLSWIFAIILMLSVILTYYLHYWAFWCPFKFCSWGEVNASPVSPSPIPGR